MARRLLPLDCASPGFAPASDAQIELARGENQARGLCAGACCEETCSCLLLQLSGEELAATIQRRLIRIVPKTIINHRVATLACID